MQDSLVLLRGLVAKSAARARQEGSAGKLTQKQVDGRITRVEKAAGIIALGAIQLIGHTEPDADQKQLNVYKVSSTSDESHREYEVTSASCTCHDFHTAPGNWCKHRLAVVLQHQIQKAQLTETRAIVDLQQQEAVKDVQVKRDLEQVSADLSKAQDQIKSLHEQLEQEVATINALTEENTNLRKSAETYQAKIDKALGAFVRTLAAE